MKLPVCILDIMYGCCSAAALLEASIILVQETKVSWIMQLFFAFLQFFDIGGCYTMFIAAQVTRTI
jgi:hypothetical protein